VSHFFQAPSPNAWFCGTAVCVLETLCSQHASAVAIVGNGAVDLIIILEGTCPCVLCTTFGRRRMRTSTGRMTAEACRQWRCSVRIVVAVIAVIVVPSGSSLGTRNGINESRWRHKCGCRIRVSRSWSHDEQLVVKYNGDDMITILMIWCQQQCNTTRCMLLYAVCPPLMLPLPTNTNASRYCH
jgi:hypothetical protein